jgi:ankyrin repeat protein
MKQTPMHWPALEGHLKIAEVLVAAGANVNQQDSYGFTPLNRALQGGHCHLVSLLLTSANVNQEQPLHQAAVQPSKLQVQQHPERREQLITAAVAAVQALLAAGADTQSKDWKGRTPLAAALADGHRQVVQVLLRHELQQYKEQQHQQKHLGHGQQVPAGASCTAGGRSPGPGSG